MTTPMLLGEFARTLDERYRVSLPAELIGPWSESECVLAKERPGCLSLWEASAWKQRHEASVELIRQKILAGKLEGRLAQVQTLGRLLSTRHRNVRLAQRGRLIIPEGFREFFGVEPNSEVLVVGAAVCVELWSPDAWKRYLAARMPRFGKLFQSLSR